MSARAVERSEPARKGRKGRPPVVLSLRSELRRLQAYGLGTQLRDVVWGWIGSEGKAGEVVDNMVYVYCRNREAAVQVLRHEVLHYELAVSRKPLVDVINALLGRANEEVYQKEERIIDRLLALIENPD